MLTFKIKISFLKPDPVSHDYHIKILTWWAESDLGSPGLRFLEANKDNINTQSIIIGVGGMGNPLPCDFSCPHASNNTTMCFDEWGRMEPSCTGAAKDQRGSGESPVSFQQMEWDSNNKTKCQMRFFKHSVCHCSCFLSSRCLPKFLLSKTVWVKRYFDQSPVRIFCQRTLTSLKKSRGAFTQVTSIFSHQFRGWNWPFPPHSSFCVHTALSKSRPYHRLSEVSYIFHIHKGVKQSNSYFCKKNIPLHVSLILIRSCNYSVETNFIQSVRTTRVPFWTLSSFDREFVPEKII